MEYFKPERVRPLFARMVDHVEREEPTLAADVMRIPVSDYYDRERWETEVEQIFRRKPLLLAITGELRTPGSYRAMTIAGVPILLTRLRSGEVRMFVNACRHRGVPVVPDGDGNANRFTCVYHAWTYAADGRLIGLPEQEMFGDIEKSCYGLTPLAVEERNGMIWGVLTPGVALDLDEWLGEMGGILDNTGLEEFDIFERVELDSNNWKITWEGYIETYHFASLHKDSFSAFILPNLTVCDSFGKHFRFCVPVRGIEQFIDRESSDDELQQYLQQSFMLFPATQLSFGYVPPEVPVSRILMSQVFPGDTPERSKTVLRILVNRDVRGTPYEEETQRWCDVVLGTVKNEDYPVIKTIQSTLRSKGNEFFTIGRNEIGIHLMHQEIDRILADGEPAASAV